MASGGKYVLPSTTRVRSLSAMTAPFQTAFGMRRPLERMGVGGYAGAVALTIRERVCAVLLVLASACALRAEAPPSDDATSRHDFADVPYWSSVFDDPARDAWQK